MMKLRMIMILLHRLPFLQEKIFNTLKELKYFIIIYYKQLKNIIFYKFYCRLC